ncbi:MAG: chorismate synthase [Bacteroidales bacterium]|nr:chorismate synthase [Bacteroidales bacterium]
MDSFGQYFKVTIFGESHGPAIGVVLDGVPENIPLSEEDFADDIARRASGAPGTTPRRESDKPKILSGVYEGYTTGSPLTIVFWNSNVQSQDYLQFDDVPRPGHADFVANIKYNFANDPRGGGHFSGRLTLPIVAAGVVAKKILRAEYMDPEAQVSEQERKKLDVQVHAELIEVGGEKDSSKWDALVKKTSAEGDSLGGIIECTVTGLGVGVGDPFWDSLESCISHAVFAIPGIRGIEFGDGFAAARMKGSQHNDPFGPDGPIKNGSGGINGGLSNGAPVVFRVAVKPTASISQPQKTWNFKENREDILRIKGRHDTCFALRTPVIVEAMAAIVIADLL